jgi:hypothetical protein
LPPSLTAAHLLVFSLALSMSISMAGAVEALIFASPDTEPDEEIPADFPYWENVTQRRYEGPSVIYLGGGFAMTARHVGMGEIWLEGEIIAPVPGSKRTMLNINGSAADAMIFELDPDAVLPDLPIIPIATDPPRLGEDVLMIGFGRRREKVIEYQLDGDTRFGFTWTRKGAKRWGTNRIESISDIVTQGNYRTRAMSLAFDEPFTARSTRFEAQAAVGDSGGGVFVQRDGEWLLAGLMISVAGDSRAPEASTLYGDLTFATDLTFYRDEILRWTRPACSNERDDDGDERIDFPLDPDCVDAADRNERGSTPLDGIAFWAAGLGTAALAGILGAALWIRSRGQRGTSAPSSTRPSSAT